MDKVKYAIIVAGGSGNRFGTVTPKQFQILSGKPILMHSIQTFNSADNNTKIIVVLPNDTIQLWGELVAEYSFNIEHEVVAGGASRTESVMNGLANVRNDNSVVAIHDGVRPMVTAEIINEAYDTADRLGSAVPAIAVTDTVRIKGDDGLESVTLDRSRLVGVQTPQTFRTEEIKRAYDMMVNSENKGAIFTDDASVYECFPVRRYVQLINGSERNIKITHKIDLAVAEILLANGEII